MDTCSFCQKLRNEVIAMVAGPGDLRICDACIRDATRAIIGETPSLFQSSSASPGSPECCNFYLKKRKKVWKLLTARGLFVCNKCIGLCNDLLAEEDEDWSGAPAAAVLEKLNKQHKISFF